ncbi:MAG TPA: 30S ribosomal protein S6--L-glutamate ligase [Candidatus Megaira endosymbiont of Hartmannula sinica]|nr:30S ribosomal protein S6--L-glutamate ligase [Candidatus Megaera endosymbiont of Hartmannula sinica]
MHIGILSRNSKIYSTKRIAEEIKARGHELSVIDPLKCYVNISAREPEIFYKNSKNSSSQKLLLDIVIPRIGASITSYGTAILRQFEVSGVYVANQSIAITRSRDKLRAHQLLARDHISMPATSYAHSASATDDLINFVGGSPLIVKVLESTQGKGVLLAETNKAAQSLINAFLNLKTDFLVQEFISESQGSDIRCFIVGGKVVASMQRVAASGEYRSNLHAGGEGRIVDLSKEERNISIKAAKVLGLNIAGVDLVRSRHGPLVLEVNSSPGLEGIEKITGINVAAKIVEYVEDIKVKGIKTRIQSIG